MYYNEEDDKEERGAVFNRVDRIYGVILRIYGVILMLISAMLAVWLISVLFFAFAEAQEQPEEPATITQPKPFEGCEAATCSPVDAQTPWCYDWCSMETRSKADIRHWDGQLWVKHWQACGVNLEAWVAYAESLQQQMSKCKKWGK